MAVISVCAVTFDKRIVEALKLNVEKSSTSWVDGHFKVNVVKSSVSAYLWKYTGEILQRLKLELFSSVDLWNFLGLAQSAKGHNLDLIFLFANSDYGLDNWRW